MSELQVNPHNLQDLKELAESNLLQGLFPDIPMTDYQHKECPGFSSSFLKEAHDRSYGHALYARENKEQTDALIFGSCVHELVLENKKNFMVLPEGMRRDTRSKEYCAFLEDANGKTILTQDQYKNLMGIYDAVRKHSLYERLFINAKIEHSSFWQDPNSGLLLKARPDSISEEGFLVDLKTTTDASINVFNNSIGRYKYHVSAAMYLDGVGKVLGEPGEEFVLFAVEKDPPYGISAFIPGEAEIEKGREIYNRALVKISEAMAGTGPMFYPEKFQDISLPAWALME